MSTQTQQKTATVFEAKTNAGGDSQPRRNPVEERLYAISTAIEYITENEEVSAKLAGEGIDEEALEEGRRLVLDAGALTTWQKTLYGRQFGAARDIEHLQARVQRAYHPVFRLARLLFGDDSELSRKLMLRGKRSDSLTGWIQQVSAFYSRVLTEEALITNLSEYGCTEADLQNGNQLLRELTEAVLKQEKQKSACETATRRRNAALRRAYDWRDNLHEKARYVFSDCSDILEKLNVPEKEND